MSDSERKLINSELIYTGKILNLRVDTLALPGGVQITREVVEHRGAVAIVPMNGMEVILVRQPRHAVGQSLLEIPAGKLEGEENPEDRARRELLEETGFVAGQMERLFSCYSTPGFSNELLHIYLAADLTYEAPDPDFDEEIEVVAMPLEEAVGLVWSGGIQDAKSIAGLLAAAWIAIHSE